MNTQLLNFGAAKVEENDYSPAEVTQEHVAKWDWLVPQGSILVLKPTVSDTTKTGIKKADSQIAEELKKMDFPMTVLAASQDALDLGYLPNTLMVINRFSPTHLESPVEGYDVVRVLLHEVFAYKPRPCN